MTKPLTEEQLLTKRVSETHDVRPVGTMEAFTASIKAFAEWATRKSGQPIPCRKCKKPFGFYDSWSELEWDLCPKCGFSRAKKLLGTPKRFIDADLFTHFPQYGLETHEFLLTKSLWIYGPTGTGKTHLGFAICHKLLQSPTQGGVMFEEFKDIAERLNGAYKPPKWQGVEQILRPYFNAEVLFVDDVYGSLDDDKPKANEQEALRLLARERNNRNAHTIFTANYDFSQLEKKGFNARTTSRLAELCKVVNLDGVDRRLRLEEPETGVA